VNLCFVCTSSVSDCSWEQFYGPTKMCVLFRARATPLLGACLLDLRWHEISVQGLCAVLFHGAWVCLQCISCFWAMALTVPLLVLLFSLVTRYLGSQLFLDLMSVIDQAVGLGAWSWHGPRLTSLCLALAGFVIWDML
jgi:hypothetical protein